MTEAERERIKYLATLLNTCAAACFTIGVVSPIAAAVYGAEPRVAFRQFALEGCGWLLVAGSLHLSVRRFLGQLR